MFKHNNIKRFLAGLLSVILVIVYFLAIDPDTKIFQDLSYGVTLLMTLEIFVVGYMSIVVIEFLPDVFLDRIFPNELKTFEKAVTTPEGAGYTVMAKSIRILAYAIILAAAIITYGGRV